MKSAEELKTLYKTDLKPKLSGMEKERKVVKKWYILTITAFILAFMGYLASENYHNNYYYILVAIFGITGIVLMSKYISSYRVYKQDFKSKIVQKIIAFINPSFLYKPKEYISLRDYKRSGIFPSRTDRYKGDDLIEGFIDKTPFSFSEIHSEHKEESTDNNGNKKVKWRTIFKGLFFVAEFNKALHERTFVVPEKAHASLFGKEKREIKDYGELVKLENPTFEHIFSVYSSSQQEARYILTPTMMEAMVHVHKQYGQKMFFSFIGDKVYCAIPIRKDMFEPKVTKSVEYKDVEEMHMFFRLIEIIINEMNLNTRIWTKE